MSEYQPFGSSPKGPVCGVSFWCQWPEYPAQLTCELTRYHDGPHVGQGFAFGPVDQSRDTFVQAMRKAEQKRKAKTRSWYQRLAGQ